MDVSPEIHLPNNLPTITRVRHEVKRRQLTVRRVEQLAPTMRRIVLGGAELAQFTSARIR
jgi:NADPH-dependent ferric siderophore reductase